MEVIYRYRIVIIAACLALLYSQGICQEDQKEKITWDDIEGITSYPANATQIFTVPYSPQPIFSEKDEMTVVPESAIPEVQLKKVEAQEIKVTPEARKEPPLQVSAQQAPVVKAKTKTEALAAGKVTSTKKRRSQEESIWQRTNTIISEELASNRNMFVTNPDRE